MLEFSRPAWLGLLIGVALMGVACDAWSGITGKISGVVVDEHDAPIFVVAIELVELPHLALTKQDGSYEILNVPPGTYGVRFQRLGFETVLVQNVVVSSDNTTKINTKMVLDVLEMDEIVVRAQTPPVVLDQTSTQTNLSAEEIEDLPVQELEDVVNLQAGVVDGHFRGGRIGEVQFQVDGVSVNNPFDNKSSLRLDRSILQEVQIISGTFDAEYGQAMSGVVNAVLKDGTREFEWNAEVITGTYLFPGHAERLLNDTIRPGGIQNYQLSLSGPLPIPDTVFLVSGRRNSTDSHIYGERRFVPTDESNFETREFVPTGDGAEVPLGFTEEWSGVVKLTNRSWVNSRASYQAVVNSIDSRAPNFAFRFNPDGLSTQETFSIAHGLDWTQTLSNTTFIDFSARQNYFRYRDVRYEDPFDSRYDDAGRPVADDAYELGAIVQGVSLNRFEQTTDSYLVKTVLRSQVTPAHLVRFGGEFQVSQVQFGTPGHLTFVTDTNEEGNTVELLDRKFDEPPDFLAVSEYHPRVAAAFVQDRIELPDITVRAGLRLDYFDSRATLPSDLRNPANAIDGAPASFPVSASSKWAVSPRLGVAYPILSHAAVHFAYGHFRQFPPLRDIFTNADYSVLERLQAGRDPGVLGNPDVKPEKTVQYEIGYKQLVSDDLGIDVTAFYKDIRDLVGVEFITTYTGAEYARLTNVDFGNVLGITFSLDHRRLGPLRVSLDYTWQQALGNSSDPRETATRAEVGEDPRPRLLPFNWDQRHTLNTTLSLAHSEAYSMGAILRVASGQPYTPLTGLGGYGNGLVTNSDRKPFGWLVDLRAERRIKAKGARLGLFARVFNLFDTRYFNGPVFASTGSADYSRLPNDATALLDPTRFYPPRRLEVGIRIAPGGDK